MSYSNENPINKLPDNIKSYLNNKVDVISLFVIKKLGQIIPMLVLGFIMAFTLLFFTFFISYSFIQWYADYVGKASTASLIVSGFYLLITWMLFVFRNALIFKPIQRGIIKGINFKEIHKSSGIRKIKSSEDIDDELSRLVEESDAKDDELNDTLDEIKEYYTYDAIKTRFFTNILQNPRPAIATILQAIMSFQSFRNRRKEKRSDEASED